MATRHGRPAVAAALWMTRALDVVFFLLIVSSVTGINTVGTTSITMRNNCSVAVWPVMRYTLNVICSAGNNFDLNSKNIKLKPGDSHVFNVPSAEFHARIWGKTGCNDTNYTPPPENPCGTPQTGTPCETGDTCLAENCGWLPQDATRASTYATFEFQRGQQYYVSVSSGFNLPIWVEPISVANCIPVGCTGDASVICPDQNGGRRKGACNIACGLSSEKCESYPAFAEKVKQACPLAHPFQPRSSCGSDTRYVLTFCPDNLPTYKKIVN